MDTFNKKLRKLTTILLLICSTNLLAIQWDYTLQDAVKKSVDTNGQTKYSIDMRVFDYYLKKISAYADNYPPQFANDEERNEIHNKLTDLINMLEIIGKTQQRNPNFLYRASHANKLGHNMDIQGSSQRAKNYYSTLLDIFPDNPKINFTYAQFLVSTSAYHFESIPYFEKALELGIEHAKFSLGLLYAEQGNTKKGLKILQEYSRNYPKNSYVQKVIKAIESGNVKFNFK